MRTHKEILELSNKEQEHKRICECGNRVIFYKKKKVICTWCGQAVYYDAKEEFKDKLLKEMRKNEIYNR